MCGDSADICCPSLTNSKREEMKEAGSEGQAVRLVSLGFKQEIPLFQLIYMVAEFDLLTHTP